MSDIVLRFGIQGPAGAASQWRTGSGAPDDSLGVDGDLYLDNDSGDVYQRVDGAYELETNITGPSGGGGGSVDSVFGRTGTVVAVNGDYPASKITNDSSVSGSTTKDALNALKTDVDAAQSDATEALGDVVSVQADLNAFEASTTPVLPSAGQKAALVGTSGTPGSGNKYVTDSDARNSNARTPSAHHTSHENNGSDEISVAGLSGVLADPQTPAVHGNTHEAGQIDEMSVAGLSGLLATPQTPATHHTAHENGGADEISVAGLSGVLADPQVANKIATAGTPVTISSTAPSTGQVLTAVDATNAEWADPSGGGGSSGLLPRQTLVTSTQDITAGYMWPLSTTVGSVNLLTPGVGDPIDVEFQLEGTSDNATVIVFVPDPTKIVKPTFRDNVGFGLMTCSAAGAWFRYQYDVTADLWRLIDWRQGRGGDGDPIKIKAEALLCDGSGTASYISSGTGTTDQVLTVHSDNTWKFKMPMCVNLGTDDPSTGAGFAATVPRIGVRDNGGATELWIKTGAGDTDWALV